jgi:hypothetical protein
MLNDFCLTSFAVNYDKKNKTKNALTAKLFIGYPLINTKI